jgi:hypothetical protein
MDAAAKLDDSDGSASDSDSSDADAFELSEQDMASMQSLEEALKADPYIYENHVKVLPVPVHVQLLHYWVWVLSSHLSSGKSQTPCERSTAVHCGAEEGEVEGAAEGCAAGDAGAVSAH